MLRTIADGFIATHATLCQAAADIDRAVKEKAARQTIARRLMTIPGIGPIVSLSFVALIDDPSRFSKVGDVGAFLGLTLRRHQSGEVDWSGRILNCDDRAV